MSLDVQSLLAKAGESLRVARLILANGSPDFASARAYYAMFYVAQAWLLSLGQTYSSHRAVIASFGKDVAHAGLVPVEQHNYLIAGFGARQQADYGGLGTVHEDEAAQLIAWAEEMIRTAEERLSEDPSPT